MVASLNINHKGQDILFEVLRQEQWRSRPVHVNLYGNGPHEKILKELAHYWSLDNVTFCGHQAIESIWSRNEILILPSRMEGLSLALLEAMKFERSAIVTKLGDSERFIEDGVSGFLVRAPQADMLDEAMERAWNKREDWQEMGKRARASLESEITVDPVAAVTDTINELLRKY